MGLTQRSNPTGPRLPGLGAIPVLAKNGAPLLVPEIEAQQSLLGIRYNYLSDRI